MLRARKFTMTVLYEHIDDFLFFGLNRSIDSGNLAGCAPVDLLEWTFFLQTTMLAITISAPAIDAAMYKRRDVE